MRPFSAGEIVYSNRCNCLRILPNNTNYCYKSPSLPLDMVSDILLLCELVGKVTTENTEYLQMSDAQRHMISSKMLGAPLAGLSVYRLRARTFKLRSNARNSHLKIFRMMLMVEDSCCVQVEQITAILNRDTNAWLEIVKLTVSSSQSLKHTHFTQPPLTRRPSC